MVNANAANDWLRELDMDELTQSIQSPFEDSSHEEPAWSVDVDDIELTLLEMLD